MGLRRVRKVLAGLTLGTVIFGVTLSTLHQSGLGALFLLAKSKIHPLWYTEFLPILFLVSSIFAGLSMVIFEGMISHRVFADQIDPKRHGSFDEIVLGLGKGAAMAMFLYFFFKVLIFVHGKHWSYIGDPWFWWFTLEVIGFVLIPCILLIRAVTTKNVTLVKIASIGALVGSSSTG